MSARDEDRSVKKLLAALREAANDPQCRVGLQPGQAGNGMGYDPRVPLPYPIFVGGDDRCENVPGYPFAHTAEDRSKLPILVGFQPPDTSTQHVVVSVDEWWEDWHSAIGLVPVFYEPGGFDDGMFSLGVLITGILEPR